MKRLCINCRFVRNVKEMRYPPGGQPYEERTPSYWWECGANISFRKESFVDGREEIYYSKCEKINKYGDCWAYESWAFPTTYTILERILRWWWKRSRKDYFLVEKGDIVEINGEKHICMGDYTSDVVPPGFETVKSEKGRD